MSGVLERLARLEAEATGRHDPCGMCDGSGPPWGAPWVVVDDIKGDGHWDNEFLVYSEGGDEDGQLLATCEYRPHAELIAALRNAVPVLLDIARKSEALAAFVDAMTDGGSFDDYRGLAEKRDELGAALSRLDEVNLP